MPARCFTHALDRNVQVRINPGVALIKPDREVAVFAPCRGCRLYGLLGWMSCEVLAQRRPAQIFVLDGFANNAVKETRPFKPPVAKQFGVKRDYHNWIKAQGAEFTQLPSPLFNKVSGMHLDRFFRCLSIIYFFFLAASGDTVIFYAGKTSASACDWAQMLHREIKTDVAIKFTVSRIARIAFVRTPDLTA